MHDIRVIRADGAAFDAAMARRGLPPQSEQILGLDSIRRKSQTELQEKQAQRNALSKQVGQMRRADQDTAALEAESVALAQGMAELESTGRNLDKQIFDLLAALPNVL